MTVIELEKSRSGEVSATAPNRHRLTELTSVRFFAALGVMLLHCAGALGASAWPKWLATPLYQGRAGVSFFFILSGFILTYNYRARFASELSRKDLADFARARLARVYPMHVITLLAATAMAMIWSQQRAPGWTWVLNLLLLQSYVPAAAMRWNTPSWSVSCEFFFYACFPFFIFLAMGMRRRQFSARWLIGMAAACYLVESVMFVAGCEVLKHAIPSAQEREGWMVTVLFVSPLFRVWEFFIGCCMGALYLNKPSLTHASTRNGVLLICFAATAMLMVGHWWGHTVAILNFYVSYTPVFAVMILTLASGATFLSPLLRLPMLVLLGEASYSLYLVHGLILGTFNRLVPGGMRWTHALLAMAIAIAASIVCYKLIELPLRQRLRGIHRRGDSSPASASYGV